MIECPIFASILESVEPVLNGETASLWMHAVAPVSPVGSFSLAAMTYAAYGHAWWRRTVAAAEGNILINQTLNPTPGRGSVGARNSQYVLR